MAFASLCIFSYFLIVGTGMVYFLTPDRTFHLISLNYLYHYVWNSLYKNDNPNTETS